MASSNNQLGITVTARDEATRTLNGIHGALQSLDQGLTSIRGRIAFGVFSQLGQQLTNLVERGIRDLIDVIPDLINKGDAWGKTVEAITLGTNMSAQASSTLAAIYQDLTGTTDGLDLALTQANKNLTAHATQLQADGITAGNVSDALDQLRQMYQKTGASSQFAATAQELLGRGWKDMLPLLAQNDLAWQKLTADAESSGRVMTQTQLDSLTVWDRTLNRMQGTITGVGAQLLAGISPVLSGIVDAFTNFIQAHLTQIVTFLSQVAVAVASFVGGLLGIDLNVQSMMGSLGDFTGATNTTTKAVKDGTAANTAYIASLQAQLTALSQGQQAQTAHQQLQQTLSDLQKAKTDLANVQANSVFAGGMSEADYILAQQRQQAEVQAAKDKIKSAEQAVARQREEMAIEQERNVLEAKIAAAQQRGADATAKAAAASQRAADATRKAITTVTTGSGGLLGDMTQSLADAKAFGQKIADTIQDAVFGSPNPGTMGSFNVGVRTGGLVDALGNVANFLSQVFTGLGNLNTWLENTVHIGLMPLAGVLFTLNIGLGILTPLLAIGGPIVSAILGFGGFLSGIFGAGGALVLALGALVAPLVAFGGVIVLLEQLLPKNSASGTSWWEGLLKGKMPWDISNLSNTPLGNGAPASIPPTDPTATLQSTLQQYLGSGSTQQQSLDDLLQAMGDTIATLQDGSATVTLPDGTAVNVDTVTGTVTMADGTTMKIGDWLAKQNAGISGNVGINNWLKTFLVNNAAGTYLGVGTSGGNTVAIDMTKSGELHNQLNDIDNRLAPWGGTSIAHWLSSIDYYVSGGKSGAKTSTSTTHVSVQLDAHETRKFFVGKRATSTTRAPSGY